MLLYRRGFTLIEVLISVLLLGIIMVALFSVVSMMRDSNTHLYAYLQKAKKVTRATKVLYLDILASDGNITIKKDEFSRLCMEETANSLYGLSSAKVCWLVLKDRNTLVRVEGNGYQLPTKFEDKVEVDQVMSSIELFDVYHKKDKVVVLLKEQHREPIMFMVQGIIKPKKKPQAKRKRIEQRAPATTTTPRARPTPNGKQTPQGNPPPTQPGRPPVPRAPSNPTPTGNRA